MTAKKNPEDRKPRGGSRAGAGRKPKLVDQATQLEWTSQLTRAITAASGNMGVIKKDAFWTLREIVGRWGKPAGAEFKRWFEATRHLNQEVADTLLLEFQRGRLDEDKYKKLLFTKAFTWVWALHSDKQREAWEITRGVRTLRLSACA